MLPPHYLYFRYSKGKRGVIPAKYKSSYGDSELENYSRAPRIDEYLKLLTMCKFKKSGTVTFYGTQQHLASENDEDPVVFPNHSP